MGKVVHTKGSARAPFERMIKDVAKMSTRVGYFESEHYPDGGPPVAYVATIMEFGWPSGGIPARPTMRPTITREQGAWRTLAASGAKAAAQGRKTVYQVFTGLGLQASGDLKKSIQLVVAPPLKDTTVQARARLYVSDPGLVTAGLKKPLVASGRMLASATFTVMQGGK